MVETDAHVQVELAIAEADGCSNHMAHQARMQDPTHMAFLLVCQPALLLPIVAEMLISQLLFIVTPHTTRATDLCYRGVPPYVHLCSCDAWH